MFTNTVQAASVPTLQYQEHAVQKSQGKNIENAQPKTNQQPQNTGQQVCIIYVIAFIRIEIFNAQLKFSGVPNVLLHDEREHDPEVGAGHANARRHSQPDAASHRRRHENVLHCATVRLQLCTRQPNADRPKRHHNRRPSAKRDIQHQLQMRRVRSHVRTLVLVELPQKNP